MDYSQCDSRVDLKYDFFLNHVCDMHTTLFHLHIYEENLFSLRGIDLDMNFDMRH